MAAICRFGFALLIYHGCAACMKSAFLNFYTANSVMRSLDSKLDIISFSWTEEPVHPASLET
jgi:hypothetical protein